MNLVAQIIASERISAIASAPIPDRRIRKLILAKVLRGRPNGKPHSSSEHDCRS